MNRKEGHFLIIESPHFTKPSIVEESSKGAPDLLDFEVLSESYSPTSKSSKLKFRAIVQEANTINQNGRYYPAPVLESLVKAFQQKIQEDGGLPAEVDHPFVETSDPQVLKRRASQIFIKEVGVLYKNIIYDNGLVIVEGVTLDNSKGQQVYSLIKEGYKIGFSLRAFGKIKPGQINGRPVAIVEAFDRPLTYDVVINPSHKSAKLVEIQESELFPQINNSAQLIVESHQNPSSIEIPGALVLEDDNIDQIPDEDLKNYLTNYLNNRHVLKITIDTNNQTAIVCVDDRFCKARPIDDTVATIANAYAEKVIATIVNSLNNLINQFGFIPDVVPVKPLSAEIFKRYDFVNTFDPEQTQSEENVPEDELNNNDNDFDYELDEAVMEAFDYDIGKIEQINKIFEKNHNDEKYLSKILESVDPFVIDEFLELADIPKELVFESEDDSEENEKILEAALKTENAEEEIEDDIMESSTEYLDDLKEIENSIENEIYSKVEKELIEAQILDYNEDKITKILVESLGSKSEIEKFLNYFEEKLINEELNDLEEIFDSREIAEQVLDKIAEEVIQFEN